MFGEAGSYLKEIAFFVGYKPGETRGRCFIDSAAKELCLLNDISVKEMGITIDFGHSMYGGKTPAEVETAYLQGYTDPFTEEVFDRACLRTQ